MATLKRAVYISDTNALSKRYASTDSVIYEAGDIAYALGKKYLFVKNQSATALTANGACKFADGTTTLGLVEPTSSDTRTAKFAGIAQAALAQNELGWIQVGGFTTATLDGPGMSGAGGDHIPLSISSGVNLCSGTVGTHHIIGYTLDSSESYVYLFPTI